MKLKGSTGERLKGGTMSPEAREEAVRKRKEQNKKRREAFLGLAEALISCLEYDTLEEIQLQMLLCCGEFAMDDEYQDLLTPSALKGLKKISLVIEEATEYKRLEGYVYNLRLNFDGLRVAQVTRGGGPTWNI